MSRADAITSLEALADGQTPEQSMLITGALWMQTVAPRIAIAIRSMRRRGWRPWPPVAS